MTDTHRRPLLPARLAHHALDQADLAGALDVTARSAARLASTLAIHERSAALREIRDQITALSDPTAPSAVTTWDHRGQRQRRTAAAPLALDAGAALIEALHAVDDAQTVLERHTSELRRARGDFRAQARARGMSADEAAFYERAARPGDLERAAFRAAVLAALVILERAHAEALDLDRAPQTPEAFDLAAVLAAVVVLVSAARAAARGDSPPPALPTVAERARVTRSPRAPAALPFA